jgi:hypothetical protein
VVKLSAMGIEKNAERFLDALVQVELHLKMTEGIEPEAYVDLETLINRSSNLSLDQKRKLNSWRRLRNVIVHSPRSNSQPIADPRDSEVSEIEKLVQIIRNPPRVSSILQLVPPVVLRWDSEVSDFFAELMPPKEFSQTPFLDEAGGYRLITSNAVARWAASSYEVSSGLILEQTQIADVAKFCEEGDRLVCRRQDLSAQSAIDILTDPQGVPPAAILLTDTGHDNGRAMGLAVKSDLPLLFKAITV